MRKTLFALLAVMALLFVGACGASGGDDESSDDPTTTSAGTEPTDDTEPDDTTTTSTEPEDTSGDLVDVEEWAESFCGDFEDWLDGITVSGETVADSVTPGDIEGAKAAIVGLFDDVAGQTSTLIDQMEAGGAPDIEDGEDFLDDLVGKFEDFLAAIESAGDEAEAVSTADPAAFQNTITELVATFQAETEEVGDSFSELDARYGDPDLDAAVQDACSFM